MYSKEEMDNMSSFTSNEAQNQNLLSPRFNNITRKYSIEKLTNHNYRMWKTRMELILERENLKEVVDGSLCIPNTKNGLKQWKSRDLDAKMELIMHLSEEQVDHIRDLETPKEMWEYPRKLHQPSDGKTKIFSYKTLLNLEMREGEQLDTFISKWKKQPDAAITTGNNLDETSKCEILMGALPSSWMTFVSIHSEDKDLNLQNLIANLKQDKL